MRWVGYVEDLAQNLWRVFQFRLGEVDVDQPEVLGSGLEDLAP